MSKVLKEAIFFVVLFLFLALGVHMQQWFSHPVEHFEHLNRSKFGLFHPLTFATLVYIFLYILRVILSAIKDLFTKKG